MTCFVRPDMRRAVVVRFNSWPALMPASAHRYRIVHTRPVARRRRYAGAVAKPHVNVQVPLPRCVPCWFWEATPRRSPPNLTGTHAGGAEGVIFPVREAQRVSWDSRSVPALGQGPRVGRYAERTSSTRLTRTQDSTITMRFGSTDTFFLVIGLAALLLVPLGLWLLTWLARVFADTFRSAPSRWFLVTWALLLLSGQVWAVHSNATTIALANVRGENLIRAALLLLTSMGLAGMVYATRGRCLEPMLRSPLNVFAVLSLWNFGTLLWSVAPVNTLYSSIEYLVSIMLASTGAYYVRGADSITTTSHLRAIFNWHWLLMGLLLLTVAGGALAAPHDAFFRGVGVLGYQLKGVLPSMAANTVGNLSAVLALVVVSRMLQAGKLRLNLILLLVAVLTTLAFAQSRSPILGLVVAVLVLEIGWRHWKLLAITLILGLISTAGVLEPTMRAYMVRGQPYGLSTLSGRTTWWAYGLQAARARPVGGYGAFVGGKYILLETFDQGSYSTIHNTYLETLLGMGTVGLLILVTGIVRTLAMLVRRRRPGSQYWTDRSLRLEALALMAFFLVRSVFSVPLIWPPLTTFSLVLMFAATSTSRTGSTVQEGGQAAAPESLPAVKTT